MLFFLFINLLFLAQTSTSPHANIERVDVVPSSNHGRQFSETKLLSSGAHGTLRCYQVDVFGNNDVLLSLSNQTKGPYTVSPVVVKYPQLNLQDADGLSSEAGSNAVVLHDSIISYFVLDRFYYTDRSNTKSWSISLGNQYDNLMNMRYRSFVNEIKNSIVLATETRIILYNDLAKVLYCMDPLGNLTSTIKLEYRDDWMSTQYSVAKQDSNVFLLRTNYVTDRELEMSLFSVVDEELVLTWKSVVYDELNAGSLAVSANDEQLIISGAGNNYIFNCEMQLIDQWNDGILPIDIAVSRNEVYTLGLETTDPENCYLYIRETGKTKKLQSKKFNSYSMNGLSEIRGELQGVSILDNGNLTYVGGENKSISEYSIQDHKITNKYAMFDNGDIIAIDEEYSLWLIHPK